MTRHHFSFKEAFVFGWSKTKQHYWFSFLTFLLICFIVNTVNDVPILRTTAVLFSAFSVAYVSLLIVRNHTFNFESLLTPLLSPSKVITFVLVAVIYSIPAILAISLLVFVTAKWYSLIVIVPSIYIMVRLKFFPYVIIDGENKNVLEVLKSSYRLTKDHFFMVFGLMVLLGLLNIAGAMAFLVGLLVTVPISIFATAYVYTRLKEHSV